MGERGGFGRSRARSTNAVLSVALDDQTIADIASRVAEEIRATLRDTTGEDGQWPAWMDIETAARFLDVSVERLRKLVARREIPFAQASEGRRVFFGQRELDAWMQAQVRQPRAR